MEEIDDYETILYSSSFSLDESCHLLDLMDWPKELEIFRIMIRRSLFIIKGEKIRLWDVLMLCEQSKFLLSYLSCLHEECERIGQMIEQMENVIPRKMLFSATRETNDMIHFLRLTVRIMHGISRSNQSLASLLVKLKLPRTNLTRKRYLSQLTNNYYQPIPPLGLVPPLVDDVEKLECVWPLLEDDNQKEIGFVLYNTKTKSTCLKSLHPSPSYVQHFLRKSNATLPQHHKNRRTLRLLDVSAEHIQKSLRLLSVFYSKS